MRKAAKRFYDKVRVLAADGGFAIALDGKTVRTPAAAVLKVASKSLACAIAAEWRSQKDEILPHRMPLTALACTAIDQVASRRFEVIKKVLQYARADLLCYYAGSPNDLAKRQQKTFKPLLSWAQKTYGAKLKTTIGVVHVKQPEPAIKALGAVLDRQNDLELTAIAAIAAATGSMVIALAVAAWRITAFQAAAAAQLDEAFQNELWGEDAMDMRRRQNINDEINAAARFLKLAGEG